MSRMILVDESNGWRVIAPCLKCNQSLRYRPSDEPCWADMDGEPWVAYYCNTCAQEEMAKANAQWLKDIKGKWPGDETDEQIDRALRERDFEGGQ